MNKYMTKEQREKLSNRVVYNFGAVLLGALVMLYLYNFLNAGYITGVLNFVAVVGILSAIAAVVMFVLGKTKYPKIKNYSGIFLGMFISALVMYSTKFPFLTNTFTRFNAKSSVILVLILMAVYFVIYAVVTGIILKTHPEAPAEKKKIQHKKKKRK